MTARDRENLEKLDTLIRATPLALQENLRTQYNLLIENWGDSQEKTRIILSMQDTLETSGLTDEDKLTLMQAMEQVLF